MPWNDFGNGNIWSNAFGIWTAIVPSGMNAPSTTLNYNSYVEEDDFIVIAWDPPSDNGGLAVWYSIEVKAKSGSWVSMNMNTECYELGLTTNYKMPIINAAVAAL